MKINVSGRTFDDAHMPLFIEIILEFFFLLNPYRQLIEFVLI